MPRAPIPPGSGIADHARHFRNDPSPVVRSAGVPHPLSSAQEVISAAPATLHGSWPVRHTFSCSLNGVVARAPSPWRPDIVSLHSLIASSTTTTHRPTIPQILMVNTPLLAIESSRKNAPRRSSPTGSRAARGPDRLARRHGAEKRRARGRPIAWALRECDESCVCANHGGDAQRRLRGTAVRHRGIAVKVASVFCLDAEDRRELARDICAEVWRASPSYDPQRRFSTWMYRIAFERRDFPTGAARCSAIAMSPPASHGCWTPLPGARAGRIERSSARAPSDHRATR